MRVLVTGASGFVGTTLVRRLVAEGVRVRGTYRRMRPPSMTGVEWLHVPQLEAAMRLGDLVAGCSTVIHLAALAHQHGRAAVGRREEFFRVNARGTQLLARASRDAAVRRVVFVSSVAAVCSQSELWVDERTPCNPQSDYGHSKLEGERLLQAELLNSKTDWCILRPPLVYGPDNPGNMGRLLGLIATGLPLPLGAIKNRRSFLFVDNLVDALLSVIRHPDPIRCAYMLADGSDFTTPELVTALAAAGGRAAKLWRLPISTLRMLGRGGDMLDRALGLATGIDSYSVDRLVGSLPVSGLQFRDHFGWRPPVEPAQALRLTCDGAQRRAPHVRLSA